MSKTSAQSCWRIPEHRFITISVVCVFLSLQSELVAAAERLIFAVHRNEAIAESPGHFVWKGSTTIYAWDARTRTRQTLFSDAGLSIVLLTAYGSGGMSQSGVVISAKSRIFALAARREASGAGPATGEPGSIYELTLDGSNEIRKIATVESAIPLSAFLVSPDGNTLTYLALKVKKPNGRYIPVLVAVDTAGRTLAKTQLSSFVKDDFNATFRWASDGQSLYWTVQPDMGDGSNIRRYVTRWDGTRPRLAPEETPGIPPGQATAPSGKMIALFREAHAQGEINATQELWLKEDGVETKIASFPSVAPGPSVGPGAASQFLTLLGWLE